MAEKFESKIVTYTALLAHQQRARNKFSKEIEGKVLGFREQSRQHDNKKGILLTISVEIDKNQALDLVNKSVKISKSKKNKSYAR